VSRVALGVAVIGVAAQPEPGGCGAVVLFGHGKGKHPTGIVFAPDFVAGTVGAGECVLGSALVAQPRVGTRLNGGQPNPCSPGLGDIAPAVVGKFYSHAGPVVPVSDQTLSAPHPRPQRVITG
jgi:hypothetical protein